MTSSINSSAFSEGSVAFLDILGFKKLVLSAENDASQQTVLHALITTLDEHVTLERGQSPHPDVPDNLKPDWIFISDSLIISSLNECGDDRDLAAVTLKAVQVANKLIDMGFLIRGGISRGLVWRKPNNIFGSAYMEAYGQEQSTEWPRVQLSSTAAKAWISSPLRDYLPVVDDLGVPVVDLFHPYYNAGGSSYGAYLDQLHSSMDEQASSLSQWSSPRLKWEWAKDFVRRTQLRHTT